MLWMQRALARFAYQTSNSFDGLWMEPQKPRVETQVWQGKQVEED